MYRHSYAKLKSKWYTDGSSPERQSELRKVMSQSPSTGKAEHSEAPPSVEIFDLSDPIDAGETIQVMGQDVVHLGPGPFHVRRVIIRMQDVTLLYHANDSRARSFTKLGDEHMAFHSLGKDSRGSLEGVELCADRLYVAGPGAGGNLIVEPAYQSIISLVSPSYIQEQLRKRRYNWDFRVPSVLDEFQTDDEMVRAYFDLGKRLTEAAALLPTIFNNEERTRIAAQNDILESLVAAISLGAPTQPTRRDRTRNAYTKLVKSCEEYSLDVGAERVSLADLCEVAGTSERTLQYAFQDIMGMTPFAYIRRLRLHRARKELSRAVTASHSVTETAMRWGFWHLGEFSRDYKACFSELPSETLKRSLGERR